MSEELLLHCQLALHDVPTPPPPTTLTLPLTIDFDDETESETPSWVTGQTGRLAPYIEVVSAVEGHTKVLRFDAGSGATLGTGTVNLALGSGQTDGLPLSIAAGVKVQILEFRQTNTDRQVIQLMDVADPGVESTIDRIYLADREENNTDTLRLRLIRDSVDRDTGDVSLGHNDSTGANWRYTRWQVTLDTDLVVDIYNTAGAHQGNQRVVSWPASGEIPNELLKHLHGVAGAGFYWRWAEIWVGALADDWPTM